MNTGEIDELKSKLALIYWRDNKLNNIEKVGFYNNSNVYYEYKGHDYTIEQIRTLDKDSLSDLCQLCNIKKAPSNFKADVCINNLNYSLKSSRGALPALINHTHRAGIEKVCKRIGLDITGIDSAINNYWERRLKNEIGEDVKISTPNNPFEIIRTDLISLLSYFLFNGTASKDSPIQAHELISFTDPLNYKTWNYFSKKDAASLYIDKVTISLRSKSMETYNPKETNSKNDSIGLWTKFIDGKYKGALHIRG